MFKHSFYYAIRVLSRAKSQISWCLFFPIILGTMFFLAFNNLSSSEDFTAIPTAVVLNEKEDTKEFKDIIDSLSKPGKDQFLEVTYTTEDKAKALLKDKKITGIIYGGSDVSLAISSDMGGEQLQQSILNSFIEQFRLQYQAIADIAQNHPEKLPDAVKTLSASTSYNKETTFSSGNLDEKLSYFFNLIAMTCLYASMAGCVLTINNQANLSTLGARKNISPISRMISLLGELCANILFQFASVVVALLYFIFVLKIDFGGELGYVLLATLVGCTTGVSMGFFIGSFGKMGEDAKIGLLLGISMIFCFLSGLMVGNMQILVEKVCPWFNRINPAVRISDSFYSLTVYLSHARYYANLVMLLIISAVFFLGGLLMMRRKKYARL